MSEELELVEVVRQLELVTGERDQYRRDFKTMSDFAAKLAARLKLQGCSDADIEAARIATPPIQEPTRARLIGSDEDRMRTDERIQAWLAQHADDAEVAADLKAALEQNRELRGHLKEISALALEWSGEL